MTVLGPHKTGSLNSLSQERGGAYGVIPFTLNSRPLVDSVRGEPWSLILTNFEATRPQQITLNPWSQMTLVISVGHNDLWDFWRHELRMITMYDLHIWNVRKKSFRKRKESRNFLSHIWVRVPSLYRKRQWWAPHSRFTPRLGSQPVLVSHKSHQSSR